MSKSFDIRVNVPMQISLSESEQQSVTLNFLESIFQKSLGEGNFVDSDKRVKYWEPDTVSYHNPRDTLVDVRALNEAEETLLDLIKYVRSLNV